MTKWNHCVLLRDKLRPQVKASRNISSKINSE